MHVAKLIVLGLLASACVAAPPDVDSPASPAEKPVSNDCATITAITKDHSKLNRGNTPATPETWRRRKLDAVLRFQCVRLQPSGLCANHTRAAPRRSLGWAPLQKPVDCGGVACVLTEIMHGPLAGIGYECRLVSGFAGWTVGERTTRWVS